MKKFITRILNINKICLGLALIISVIIWGLYSVSPKEYVGKILLDKEQYENFKLVLSDPEIRIRDINTLNSDPYLVDFKILTPHNYNFPYGKEEMTEVIIIIGLMTTIAVSITIFGICIAEDN